jgi:hypothetical protein
LGASLAPPIATLLASHYGVAYVGYYLSAAGLVTMAALLLIKADRSSAEPHARTSTQGEN